MLIARLLSRWGPYRIASEARDTARTIIMPERVVAGFSLRPIPFLSQAWDPRVAIGRRGGLAPALRQGDGPGLRLRSYGTGPSPDLSLRAFLRGLREGVAIASMGRLPRRPSTEPAPSEAEGLGPPRNDRRRGCQPRRPDGQVVRRPTPRPDAHLASSPRQGHLKLTAPRKPCYPISTDRSVEMCEQV